MQHIREGLDHLLFLIVLLLPAMLTVRNGVWAQPGDARCSLVHLARIVSAFTLGHSATLAAGALHWVRLPQEPVEVLIAFSVLVTAIHAIRPIFPGREAYVAAGFGLVHGLAFASAISDLQLPTGPLVLSIFGFKLSNKIRGYVRDTSRETPAIFLPYLRPVPGVQNRRRHLPSGRHLANCSLTKIDVVGWGTVGRG